MFVLSRNENTDVKWIKGVQFTCDKNPYNVRRVFWVLPLCLSQDPSAPAHQPFSPCILPSQMSVPET